MEIIDQIELHERVVSDFKKECVPVLSQICAICSKAIQNHHKILLCGNGGSAADAQHIAAEFIGRFHKERKSLPSIALTTDTSILTSIANDYSYDVVFSRQVEGLGQEGDILIGISTSGNSKNVVNALNAAKKKGMTTIAFTGRKESACSQIADYTLRVPSEVTARIQECHIMAGHIICESVDELY